METETEKIRVAKTEKREGKRGSKKGARRKGKGEEGKTEKTKEGKNDRHKENSRRMGDMGRGEKAAKLEVEAKKLVPEKFHKWIKVFSKKQSEWIPTRKVWNHAIDVRKGFVPRKRKVYPLSREERGSTRIYQGTVKKRVHQALEIAPNSVSILCKKEG